MTHPQTLNKNIVFTWNRIFFFLLKLLVLFFRFFNFNSTRTDNEKNKKQVRDSSFLLLRFYYEQKKIDKTSVIFISS
jgi:hypothetical protein